VAHDHDALSGVAERCRDLARGLALPEPVRTAQTATVGTFALSVVSFGPRSVKLAPAARTSLALCITYWWETSE
jgi:hypothetical protein